MHAGIKDQPALNTCLDQARCLVCTHHSSSGILTYIHLPPSAVGIFALQNVLWRHLVATSKIAAGLTSAADTQVLWRTMKLEAYDPRQQTSIRHGPIALRTVDSHLEVSEGVTRVCGQDSLCDGLQRHIARHVRYDILHERCHRLLRKASRRVSALGSFEGRLPSYFGLMRFAQDLLLLFIVCCAVALVKAGYFVEVLGAFKVFWRECRCRLPCWRGGTKGFATACSRQIPLLTSKQKRPQRMCFF